MSNRQSRAFVLLAGNGAALLFAANFFVAQLAEIAMHDMMPFFLLVTAIGVAAAYGALVTCDDTARVALFRWFEGVATAALSVAILAFVALAFALAGWIFPGGGVRVGA